MIDGDLLYTQFGTIANPAAGDEFSVTCLAGECVRIYWLKFNFTTSVAVANRTVYAYLTNGIGSGGWITSDTVQGGSLSVNYSFIGGYGGAPYTLGGIKVLPFYDRLKINNLTWLHIAVTNMQAADQISGITYYFDKWLINPGGV